MATAGKPSTQEMIDVCVCTFRRSSLRETLASIAGQVLPLGFSVRVVIADNDTTSARRHDIISLCQALDLDHIYVHAPERNISRARNACLDNARSNWIAFIDDDEIAQPDWLAQLIDMREDAHCVFGVARAIYPGTTSTWMIDGDFHSHSMGSRDSPFNGSTCNVFIDRLFVEEHEIRFRNELGTVGGEDTMFFHDMFDHGGEFRYAPNAIVEEPVVASRATLKWLLKRRFRSGQIHYLVLRRAKRERTSIAIGALARIVYCGTAALFSMDMADRVRRLSRGSLHLGVLASACGASLYQEYA